jgi:PAS domain S-box-containing protein
LIRSIVMQEGTPLFFLRQTPAGRLAQSLRYGTAVVAVLIALLLSQLLWPIVAPNPFVFFLAAVAISAWYGGLGPGLLATALAVMAVNYYFIPPVQNFKFDAFDGLRLGVFALVAVLISSLSESLHRAKQTAHTQREQLQVTLASIGDAVIATDTTGRITFMNAVAATLTGWTPEAARRQPIDAVFRSIHATTRQPVEAPVMPALRAGMAVELASQTLLLGRDGVARPIDDSAAPIRAADGRPLAVVLVFRDVTEREQATAMRIDLLAREQAARAEAERAHERAAFLAEASRLLAHSLDYTTTLQEVANLLVPRLADWCVVDLLDDTGQLQMMAAAHVDPAKVAWAYELRQQYPVDPEARVGAPQVIRTGTPELYPDIPDSLLQSVARNADELRILRGVGYRSVMIAPLRTRERILGTLSLVAAESARRYTPGDLRFAQELADRAAVAIDNATLYQAAQAARTAAEAALQLRDLFLSIAAHELKTPLTALLLQAQMLQRRAQRSEILPAREQHMLQVITDQAHRLDRLIAALLDISRIERGQLSLSREPVDLGALVQRVVAEVQPISEQHTITCEALNDGLIVDGDELRLEQVIQNLLQNAIKYSPDGGPVAVTMARQDGMVCVSVTDRGIGIPEEAFPQLFERFYRAPNANPHQISGMGIGLYVVKEIVRLHGGSVTATCPAAGGSRFTVCLPTDSYQNEGQLVARHTDVDE